MKWTFPAIALSCLLALRPGFSADYPQIVAFGDSLTDMGNRTVETRRGNYTYRETWIKQLAGRDMLNVPDFKPSGMSHFFGGTNYAVGGSTTEFTAKRSQDRHRGQNLTQQVTRRYLNPAFNKDGVKPEALHVVIMGTNDLMRACIAPDQIMTGWASFDQIGVEVARSSESQIKALAAAGVKHVLWGNLFDCALTPSIVTRVYQYGGTQAALVLAALTKATLAHNTEMDTAIQRLQTTHPGLKVMKLDLFARLNEVAADPEKFGFKDITKGANDSRHLFSADGLHPTPQGHKMLAAYAYEVLRRESSVAMESAAP
jgi:phospholipase/lecithinase/hemolysin